MLDPFVHGNPFYGSVVYLIPDTATSRDWWQLLSIRPSYWMRSPRDLRLLYVDRTTAGDGGYFTFSKVRPGDYFLHASVFWTTFAVGGESTQISGRAWIGRTTVAARETAQVKLRPPEYVFRGDVVGTPEPPPTGPAPRPADSLPAWSEYVYVEELPEVTKKVPPIYPNKLLGTGVDGTVLVRVLVDRSGRVRDARVVKSIPALDEAAVVAVRQYEFRPARRGKKPVAVWTSVGVRFAAP